jgi:hypothetical protein
VRYPASSIVEREECRFSAEEKRPQSAQTVLERRCKAVGQYRNNNKAEKNKGSHPQDARQNTRRSERLRLKLLDNVAERVNLLGLSERRRASRGDLICSIAGGSWK